MSDGSKEDIRIVKSKRDLRNALAELMKEVPYSEISVIGICNAADINRMTFYKHYGDKAELLKDCFADAKKRIITKAEEKLAGLPKQVGLTVRLRGYVDVILHEAEDNKDFLLAIIAQNELQAQDILMSAVADAIGDAIENMRKDAKLAVSKEVAVNYLLGAFASVIFGWLKNPKNKTRKDLYGELCVIISGMLNSTTGIIVDKR